MPVLNAETLKRPEVLSGEDKCTINNRGNSVEIHSKISIRGIVHISCTQAKAAAFRARRYDLRYDSLLIECNFTVREVLSVLHQWSS
jgi:hypothetical protein